MASHTLLIPPGHQSSYRLQTSGLRHFIVRTWQAAHCARGTLIGLFVTLLLSVWGNPAQAGDGPRSLNALRAPTPPRIDGVLDETLWTLAEAGSDFIQKEPQEGKPSTQKTRFHFAFDHANLYVGAGLSDTSEKGVSCRLTRRDRDSESDWFGVVIDAFHDKTTARMFAVNASGVQRDATFSNDSQMDDSWDSVWESAILCDKSGWSVEMRIPFSALRFASLETATFGMNALRYISGSKEESWWSPISSSSNRFVSAAGRLTGLSTAHAPRRLALIPYAATNVQLNTDTPSGFEQSVAPNFGMDLQFGLTTDMTLDLTVNPDFGQVEVDQEVVNLSAFQPFFPEKRPFFLEGASIFQTAGVSDGDSDATRLFYSRTIGQDMPILAAAKVSGRTSSGLSIGFLNALTGYSFARNLNPTLADAPEEVANFTVARAQQAFGAGSYVGGMVTTAQRPEALGRDSYMGAVDTIFRWGDGAYSIAAALAGSSVVTPASSTEAGRTPATSMGAVAEEPVPGASTTTLGSHGLVLISKDSGEHFVGSATYGFISPEFNVDDLGFNQRTDQHGGWYWGQYRNLSGLGPIRTLRVNHSGWLFHKLESGLREGNGANINANVGLKNYWGFYAGGGFDGLSHDFYEVETGDAIWLRPTAFFSNVGLNSDGRKPVLGYLNCSFRRDTEGGGSFYVSPSLEFHLGSQVELSLGSSFGSGMNQQQWAFTEEATGTPYFGRRDYYELGVSTRGAATFSDKLSLQVFGQLLSAVGTYRDYQPLLADGTLGIGMPACGDTCPNPNFNIQYFNTNAILRWEYRPGSTLFGVWTHTREIGSSDASASLGDSLASNFSHGSNNTLMLKLNYRWGT